MAKRVVVLKNLKSSTIDQAILVIKDGCTKENKNDIISEAEKIIDGFVYKEKYNEEPFQMYEHSEKKSRKFDIYLNIMLICLVVSIIYVMFRYI